MNVLLIAPDSKFDNIAIGKISAYFKERGDNVGFGVSSPNKIFASILFPKNRGLVARWRLMYPDAEIIVGGPGYNPAIRLPPEIEKMPPDRSLYNSQYSIARVTSGCNQKCPLGAKGICIVPQLEPNGNRYIMSPNDQYKPGTVLRLLDDNILCMPKAFWEVHDFCIQNKVKVHFEYLDCRLITSEIAKGLKEMKHDAGLIHFSYDVTAIEPAVKKAVAIMKEAGFRSNAMEWFIYLHDEASIPDAKYRWNVIRSLGCEPFLMVNNDARTARLRKIARRGCRPAIWRNLSADEVFA
jgi:hypothetical protein